MINQSSVEFDRRAAVRASVAIQAEMFTMEPQGPPQHELRESSSRDDEEVTVLNRGLTARV